MLPEIHTTEEIFVVDDAVAGISCDGPMVRILSPDGDLGYIPEAQLEQAVEAGARVMTPEDMRQMRQEVFMQHSIFKSEHARPKPRKRRSIVRGGRR